MAAKKKPAAKKTAVKKPLVTDRCPTCGMAPCNVPADMRKTGKPQAKAKAAPRTRKPKVGEVVLAKEVQIPTDEEPTFERLGELTQSDDGHEDLCPLCDEPEDACLCGTSMDDDVPGEDN